MKWSLWNLQILCVALKKSEFFNIWIKQKKIKNILINNGLYYQFLHKYKIFGTGVAFIVISKIIPVVGSHIEITMLADWMFQIYNQRY